MFNPYDIAVLGKCAGCFGEIYDGEEYLEFWALSKVVNRSIRFKVHCDGNCLAEAMGAIPSEETLGHVCDGCLLEILAEHDTGLVFTQGSQTCYVHDDAECLKTALNVEKRYAGCYYDLAA